ncbi:MAG: biotin--[acetyl-CoA-carboxylase] ligase [Bacillota bacterium]|nr:biotin--[acetyl-CoA-carboxylase] ligase [Bacillota bacterium]
MKGVYVGLGANVGDRAGNLFRARRTMAALPGTRLVAVSRLYETEPVGYRDQPWFLNQVVELETELPPRELLEFLLDIETELGRVRTVRWGPRALDLDLLLYGPMELSTLALTLPHPRMWNRAFVLAPLAELAPELRTPEGEPVAEAASRLAEEQPLRLWHPRLLGEPLFRYPELDSTNAEALRQAARGAPAGTVIAAGSQTAGRGRQGRAWLSPPGLGLYLSALFRPAYLSAAAAPLFAVIGAVAACRTARVLGADKAALKWPNDLMVGGRKAGGVLAEAASTGAELASVALGVGLNLNHRPEDFPPELRRSATSLLQAAGKAIPPERAERALLAELNEVYLEFLSQGPERLIAQYREHLATLGREVRISGPSTTLVGRAVDVETATGALVIELRGGQRQVCAAGEVSLRTLERP